MDTQELSSTSPPLIPGDPAPIDAPSSPTGADQSAVRTINRHLRDAGAHQGVKTFWGSWYAALQKILPVYIATHVAFLLLTYLATLFTLGNFTTRTLRMASLLHAWYRWDSGHYVLIATKGYVPWWESAFFPLYPLLERGLAFIVGDPFIAGLLIANLAGLGMLIVLYRLVEEDFDAERAYRTVLYLSVFPTAFFFAAAYTESLFLLLALLSFYHMRRGHWWLAGLFGFLATLTRSAGVLLLLPFCYEYLRQRRFSVRSFRFNAFSGLLIPAGIGVFALYCYLALHDPLAFSHAQVTWRHKLELPWSGMLNALTAILQNHILSFTSIHNMIDLSAGLGMLILVVLCFAGPWKFPRELWAYALFAAIIYLFSLLNPLLGDLPLASLSRYALEIFPAFIVLAAMGKKEQFNLYYLTFSITILSFLLLQFLTGHWIV